jgi:hypothetical protein
VSGYIRQQEEIADLEETLRQQIATGEYIPVDPTAREMHIMELSD